MVACEVCGNEEARYVCSNCNKRIGLLCFSREGWLCATCAKLERPDSRTEVSSRKRLPLALLLLAFIMIIAGYVLLAISATPNNQGSFVVVFPFFFASSGGSGLLFVTALILTALMIVLAYLTIRRPAHNR